MFSKRFADFQGHERNREYFFGSRHVYRAGYMRRQARRARRGAGRGAAWRDATRIFDFATSLEIIGAGISEPTRFQHTIATAFPDLFDRYRLSLATSLFIGHDAVNCLK